MSLDIYLDMSGVLNRLVELDGTIVPNKLRKGLTEAGKRFMLDCVLSLPTMPIKRPGYPSGDARKPGELRSSGALFVDGVKKGNTSAYGENATSRYQPNMYGGESIKPDSHEACIVFNAPYAAEQHERWPSKTEPTAGMKYMERKLDTNAKEYMSIVVENARL